MHAEMGLFDFFKGRTSFSKSKTTISEATTTVNRIHTSTEEAHEPEKIVVKESLDSIATTASMDSSTSNYSNVSEEAELEINTTNNNQDDAISSVIQNYEILRELGRGATAIVQLGRKKQDLAQLVAFKVYKTSLLKKMREVKRVGRRMVVSTALDKVQVEIAIMKKLLHVNLINLLEVLDDDTETLVLMLEYAPHGQIMQWDSASKKYLPNPSFQLNEATLRSCVRQLLLGLEYLHQNNICHRDLKPENILVGANGVCKIADFGVAHLFEDQENEQAANKKKGYVTSTAGTYAFMGPETLKGGAFCGYTADLWALGVTLYAMVYGTIPYYDPDVLTLFEKIEKDPIELPDVSNQSGGVQELLRGLLEKDPEKRWSIAQCKQHAWILEDLEDEARPAFVHAECEQVSVSSEEVANAVTRVTSLNVILRVKLGANKWKRKAMKTLEHKRKAAADALGHNNVQVVVKDHENNQTETPETVEQADMESNNQTDM